MCGSIELEGSTIREELENILKYINLIRQRAVFPIWKIYPEEVKTIKMRQLATPRTPDRHAFRGYRFFITRTWRIAEETENGPVAARYERVATDHTPTGKFWQRTVAEETRVFNRAETISSQSHRRTG